MNIAGTCSKHAEFCGTFEFRFTPYITVKPIHIVAFILTAVDVMLRLILLRSPHISYLAFLFKTANNSGFLVSL